MNSSDDRCAAPAPSAAPTTLELVSAWVKLDISRIHLSVEAFMSHHLILYMARLYTATVTTPVIANILPGAPRMLSSAKVSPTRIPRACSFSKSRRSQSLIAAMWTVASYHAPAGCTAVAVRLAQPAADGEAAPDGVDGGRLRTDQAVRGKSGGKDDRVGGELGGTRRRRSGRAWTRAPAWDERCRPVRGWDRRARVDIMYIIGALRAVH